MTWSASRYSKFEAERNRPIEDLLARISPVEAGNAVDIGCGPGNSTELVARHLQVDTLFGIDSSPDMLAAARKRLPRVTFEHADISSWQHPGPFDVIFANAVLQWVPDHAAIIPALLAKLAPGGRLAVQVPDNLDEPAHALMRETAAAGPWASQLENAAEARSAQHDAPWYVRLIRENGAAVDIWRTTYFHHLPGGPAAIVEWFESTGLRPFLQPLDASLRAAFLTAYEAALAKAYPALPDGSVLLPFPRLFFVATRPA